MSVALMVFIAFLLGIILGCAIGWTMRSITAVFDELLEGGDQ